MFDDIENLKIVSCLKKASSPYGKMTNRPSNAFNIRISGSVLYDFYDKQITINEGELIFIPKGACYTHQTISDSENQFISINFEGDFTDASPKAYSIKDFVETDYIYSSFADLWKFGTQSERYKCISLFYNLLAFISNLEHSRYKDKSKFSIIEPAVEYLKKHIYSADLKTSKLHRLCGISDTYFRKIFVARFKVSPQSYIASRRISHAKSILDSGDFDTIKDVALSVGYTDPLYFSKVFKNKYGVSPSKGNK